MVSQVQQGSEHSFQLAAETISLDLEAAKGFVRKLAQEIENLGLGKEDADVLRAEVATVESQLESPRPRHPVVRECLSSMRHILEGATGGAAAQLLPPLLALLAG